MIKRYMHTDPQLLCERSTYPTVQSSGARPRSEFRLAVTEEEYRAAWSLAGRKGSPNLVSRDIPPELLFTFIYIQDGECLGMLAMVRDSSLGLPGDIGGKEAIDFLRSQHKRIAEISVYSILPSPIRREMVLAQLTLCALRVCEEYRISGIVVNPMHEDSVFLEGLIGFTKVGEKKGEAPVGNDRWILGLDLADHRLNWRVFAKRTAQLRGVVSSRKIFNSNLVLESSVRPGRRTTI